MSVRCFPPLTDFTSLVQAVDPDAPVRLPLVYEAIPVLYEGVGLAAEEARKLADRFERWRYQLLNKRDGHLSPEARNLADILDLALCQALGRQRLPKAPRAALTTPLSTHGPRVEAALEPGRSLDEVAEWARQTTTQHFAVPGNDGPRRRMLLYAPLYLSNFCINHCLYCPFRYPHHMEREHLTTKETLEQADILMQRGFRHILLVAGEFPRLTSIAYLAEQVRVLAERGCSVAVEIAPQTTAAYAEFVRAGALGVTLYQETYQEDLYSHYHRLGTKVWYDWRLEGLERAAEAGMSRLGLGILLGLADARQDLQALMGHGRYLQERFPAVQLAFSLPRIHEAPESFQVPYPVDDDTFIRMYCALRLAFPKAELVLSTREPPALRDLLAEICITQLSAGSSTSPGGYGEQAKDSSNRQQFPVCDPRSPAEVAEGLCRAGFDVRWEIPGRAWEPLAVTG